MKLLNYIIFYVVTAIPAYILIYFGLTGIGILQPYSFNINQYGYTSYVPTSQFALYYILVGSGITFGIILHLIKKLNNNSLEGLTDFLKLKSGLHTHHCEYSSLFTYMGIGAFVTVIIMYFILQITIVNNLIPLFGISLISGIGAVLYYRHENQKWPW